MAESEQTTKRLRYDSSVLANSASSMSHGASAGDRIHLALNQLPEISSDKEESRPTTNVEESMSTLLDNLHDDTGNLQIARLQPGTKEYNDIVAPMNKINGFYSVSVYKVNNDTQYKHFVVESETIAKQNNGMPNTQRLLYCTSVGRAAAILKKGFIRGFSASLFGQGIYFADNFLKMNAWSEYRGNDKANRVMLICDVSLGKIKQIENGYFDRKITELPKKCHSQFQLTKVFLVTFLPYTR